MAFTRVVGPGIHTQANIDSHNIHSTGIITAVSFVGDGSGLTGINTDFIVGTAITMGTANFTGNVTIGGTLTYEDVKNIDSVGLITARDGIFLPNDKKAKFGNTDAAPRLSIWHTGSQGYIRNGASSYSAGYLNLDSYYHRIRGHNGNQMFIYCETNNYVGLYYQNNLKFATTSTGARVIGTLNGASEVGIQSGGVQIGAGITQLNFVGTGNTFAVNGTTVDISISGGSAGAGGTWSTYTAGIATSKSVGVNTSNLDDNDLVGVGNSFQGLYISNGMMITDNKLSGNHYIGTAFNGLMAGPVNIEGTLTIDGNYVVV